MRKPLNLNSIPGIEFDDETCTFKMPEGLSYDEAIAEHKSIMSRGYDFGLMAASDTIRSWCRISQRKESSSVFGAIIEGCEDYRFYDDNGVDDYESFKAEFQLFVLLGECEMYRFNREYARLQSKDNSVIIQKLAESEKFCDDRLGENSAVIYSLLNSKLEEITLENICKFCDRKATALKDKQAGKDEEQHYFDRQIEELLEIKENFQKKFSSKSENDITQEV